jgi:hypothetical protein
MVTTSEAWTIEMLEFVHHFGGMVNAQARAGAAFALAKLGLQRVVQTHENDVDFGIAIQDRERRGNRDMGAVIAPHGIDCDCDIHQRKLHPARGAPDVLFALGGDDFLAAIVAAGAHVVTQMHLASRGFDREGRIRQKVVRAVHATLRRRLLILLNCHDQYSLI